MKNLLALGSLAVLCATTSATMALPSRALVKTRPAQLRTDISFDETVNRYPSPTAILKHFERIVPVTAPYSSSQYPKCADITADSYAFLGVMDPQQGAALESEPGPFFVEYYAACIKEVIKANFNISENGNANAEKIFTPSTYRKLVPSTPVSFWTTPLLSLSSEAQNLFLQESVEFLVGPSEILEMYKYIGTETVFGEPIADSEALAKFLLGKTLAAPDAIQSVTLQNAYESLAIQLRLGPAIKQ